MGNDFLLKNEYVYGFMIDFFQTEEKYNDLSSRHFHLEFLFSRFLKGWSKGLRWNDKTVDKM